MTTVLCADNISKTYGSGRLRAEVLRGVSMSLAAGEAVALMGPSGCGKSTLLGTLGLVLRPSSGNLRVRDADVDQDERHRARLRNEVFGYVHQDFAIVDDETVERNVAIPLEYASPRVRRAERRERVGTALDDVGLAWAVGKRASRLSGGERQRVAIARALVNRPAVVLADEPTAALDTATAREVISLLLSLRERGTSLLLATHDPRVAERCDRVLRMSDGQLVADVEDHLVPSPRA